MSSADKQLMKGFQSIADLCNNLNLNDVCAEDAKLIFKTISDQRGLKGRSYMAMVAACVFIAGRRNNPRSIREISKITNIEQKEILRCYSIIKKLIPNQIVSGRSAADYATRFAYELNFLTLQARVAKTIAERAIELEILTGKSPLSIASAAVYIVGKLFDCEKSSMSEISEASTMKDVTIKNCVKIMSIRIQDLVNGFDIDQKKIMLISRGDMEYNMIK